MAVLGLRRDLHIHSPVTCLFQKIGGSSGSMEVTFKNNVHGHEGPYLIFDETIRGFGIRDQEFKPRYTQFAFKENGMTSKLTCKSDGHVFSLTFGK